MCDNIKFKKQSELYSTGYEIYREGKEIGVVSKELSGGFSFFWECDIGECKGIAKTRKEAVKKALSKINN